MLLSNIMDGIKYFGSVSDCEISGITSDSRSVVQGSAFVCVKGETTDGHKFAAQALEKGAAVVVCERELNLPNQIIVGSTREALAVMCENFFGNPLKRLKLIGVTGTNGKTSTTFITKHILESCGHKCGLIGTICNMVGSEVIHGEYTTPDICELHSLFARMADAGCEYVVMEVSSQALAQGRVSNIHFQTACFTNLTEDHLDFHKTMDAYFKAKSALFSMTDVAVINIDDPWGVRISVNEGTKLLTYGIDSDKADLRAENEKFSASGARFDLCFGGKRYGVSIPTPGRFSVYNALSAAGCAISAGISPEQISEELGQSGVIKGRAEVYPTERDFTIILDYAHTPDGVENILSSMRAVSDGRLVALLGCGGDRDPLKRPLMGEAASRLADFVIVTSDNPRSEDPEKIIEQIIPGVEKHDTPYVKITNRREAIKYAVENALPNDVIVLAGKGHEDYQILADGKIHFDEREVLDEIFEELNATQCK